MRDENYRDENSADGDAAKPQYPPGHEAGMRVPKGGSMCKNCRFLDRDTMKDCTERNFIAWEGPDKPAGSSEIPYAIDEYCSDWWGPKKEKPLGKDEARGMTFREILDSMRPAEQAT